MTTKTLNISRSKIFYREKLIYLAWKSYFQPTDVSFFVWNEIFTNLSIIFFSFLLHEYFFFQFSCRKRKCFTVAFQRYHIHWLRPSNYEREKSKKCNSFLNGLQLYVSTKQFKLQSAENLTPKCKCDAIGYVNEKHEIVKSWLL